MKRRVTKSSLYAVLTREYESLRSVRNGAVNTLYHGTSPIIEYHDNGRMLVRAPDGEVVLSLPEADSWLPSEIEAVRDALEGLGYDTEGWDPALVWRQK